MENVENEKIRAEYGNERKEKKEEEDVEEGLRRKEEDEEGDEELTALNVSIMDLLTIAFVLIENSSDT